MRILALTVSLCFLFSGCVCVVTNFTVTANGGSGRVLNGQTIAPQKVTLVVPTVYGNGCAEASNTVTSVEFFNGTNRLGVGTKSVNTFTFDWNIVAGQDGVATAGVTQVSLTAIDQTGTRSTPELKFSVQVP
jgi:hypothetical protein